MGLKFNPLIFAGFDSSSSGGGGSSPSIGGTITGGLNTSVLFINPNGTLSQDPTNFNFNAITHALTITGPFSASNFSGSSSGTNTGDVTLASVGSSPNINAASLSGQILTLQPADGSNPGLVSITTQTFAGNKTFIGTITASNLSGTNTGDVTIGTPNGLSLAGQVLSLGLSSTSTTGALSSTDWNTFNNGATNAANRSLSNLTTPTAINQNLTFDSAGTNTNRSISTANQTSVVSGNLTISTGTSTLTNNTGNVTISTGSAGTAVSGNILLTVGITAGAETPVASNNVGTGSFAQCSSNTEWLGQGFQPTSSTTINQVIVQMNVSSSAVSGSNVVRIYSNNSGVPGTILATSSSVDLSVLTTSFQPITYNFSDLAVTSGTQYYFIIDFTTISGQNGGNKIDIESDNTNPYAGGSFEYSSNGGLTWQTFGGIYDLVFTVNGSGGSGIRGNIQFRDGSEGTSGQVWTSTDTVGSGHWAAITISNAAVIGKVLTGFVSGPNSPVLASDSILQGIEKLQAQVSASGSGTVTSVALTAPSIFTVTGSPVTTSGTLNFNLNTQTANTVFAGPSSGGPSVPTFRTLVATDIPTAPVVSPGDLNEGSFTAADNQVAPADITGFAFANATVRSFDALVSIVRDSTYATYSLYGIQKAASWEMSQASTGDVTGIVFSITNAGQIQYTSTSTGFTSLIKFRAITTSV